MSTYIVGDLQGCLAPLQKMLKQRAFKSAADRLLLVGDLVNRGPASLDTLRFVRDLGDSAITVLGNHDLHLLAVANGVRKPSPKDTLDDILNAPDCDELMDWLRTRPLLYRDNQFGLILVHAGIHAHWDLPLALKLAHELESALSADSYRDFLQHMYGNCPSQWSNNLGKRRRQRFAVNVFTRMRYCRRDGTLDFDHSGPPSSAPPALIPWYRVPRRQLVDQPIVFGHWSSHPGMAPSNILPLDRGCVWGGHLTAFVVEENHCITVRC